VFTLAKIWSRPTPQTEQLQLVHHRFWLKLG